MADSHTIIHLKAPFDTTFEWFAQKITLENFPELTDEAEELYEKAAASLKPQSIHKQSFIDSYDTTAEAGVTSMQIDGISFSGKVLDMLKDVHRVFPYIATCGTGLEDLDLSSYDFLAPYWIDILKTEALRTAQHQLKEYVIETYHIGRANSLNPGSGNVDIWPIEALQGIFSILGESSRIGVSLTDSSLMIPNKTISGLFFDTEHLYESCAYCSRTHCPDRRVPFERSM